MTSLLEDQPIEAEQRQGRQRRATEFASTILLAFASVVTSWSGYQASLWSGIQATNYNQANALRVESTRQSTIAGQLEGLDIALFMAWINAKASSNDRLEQFYRERFRPEFRSPFDAWLATNPLTNPQAPASPFALPGYRSEALQHARELENQAKALFDAGHRANHYADSYVLCTVMLAIVLFFCGIIQQFAEFRTRAILLGMAMLLLIFGLSRMLVLPRAESDGVLRLSKILWNVSMYQPMSSADRCAEARAEACGRFGSPCPLRTPAAAPPE
jgi:hypothetical protein